MRLTCIFKNTLLNISPYTYNFFVIVCLFVQHKALVVRFLLGPGINKAMQIATIPKSSTHN